MTTLHTLPNPATVTWWLLIPMAALALGRLLFVSVRWLHADTETRISLRQARRIRRTWRRLAPMVELAVKDPTPTQLQQLRSDGTPIPAKVRIPRITTRADAFGVTVTAGALPRVGLEAWQDAADDLCNGWGMLRVKVTQPRPGTITARGFRREPLDTLIPSPLLRDDGTPAVAPGALTSTDDVLLGWDEDGTPIRVNLATGAHGLIAGVTRSGKSITVNTLLASASLMRDVQLVVIDPNLAAAAPLVAHRPPGLLGDPPRRGIRGPGPGAGGDAAARGAVLVGAHRPDHRLQRGVAAPAGGDRRGRQLHPPQ